MPGIFITFEGGDGSGKSTQTELLVTRLKAAGYPVVQTIEPGGTQIGFTIRDIILNSRIPIEPLTELLLFSAARAENVETVIKPAIKRGAVVVCDRFTDSTLAYQGYGKNLNLDRVRALNQLVVGGLSPDLTVLLDVDPEVSLKRRAESEGDRIGGHLQLGFDMGDLLAGKRDGGWEIEVHQKIRAGYRDLSHIDPDRWLVIDATASPGQLAELIWSRVQPLVKSAMPEGHVGDLFRVL